MTRVARARAIDLVTIRTLLAFLVGRRQAIVTIAQTPGAVWFGLLLVLSAAFAREYDGEDLLHAPWHLVLPAGASVVSSAMLFALLWGISRGARPGWGALPRAYLSFLGLYWMTAPLAWLYALPVERFSSAAEATASNLWLLGIVAAWRVVLMIRVVSVLYGAKTWQAICIVMAMADSLALVLLWLTPLPVVSIMGGIRLSESEQMIQSTAFLVGMFGVIAWPVWFAGTLSVLIRKELSWETALSALPIKKEVGRSTWVLGIASLLVWIPVLPLTQPEQQLRRRVERDLREGQIERALATISAHGPGEFPPHWDPPPRIGYGERNPYLLEIMEPLLAMETAPWVRELFLEKLRSLGGSGFGPSYFFYQLDPQHFDRYLSVLEALPADSPIILEWREALVEQSTSEERSEIQRERLRALLDRR